MHLIGNSPSKNIMHRSAQLFHKTALWTDFAHLQLSCLCFCLSQIPITLPFIVWQCLAISDSHQLKAIKTAGPVSLVSKHAQASYDYYSFPLRLKYVCLIASATVRNRLIIKALGKWDCWKEDEKLTVVLSPSCNDICMEGKQYRAHYGRTLTQLMYVHSISPQRISPPGSCAP